MSAFVQLNETVVNVDHIQMITPGEQEGYAVVVLRDETQLRIAGSIEDVTTAINVAVSRAGGHPPMEIR